MEMLNGSKIMNTEKSESLFSLSGEENEAGTRIVALGVGGMGRNAMENLASSVDDGLELFSVNTDMQALEKCVGSRPVQIGVLRTSGKGAGGNSEVGRLSAEDDIENLRELVAGAELVFIAAGMGGGTGTGAAPVIARVCREMGVLTIGTVTMPMACEGPKRAEKARQGLKEIRRHVDSLVIVENEKLSLLMDRDDVSIIEVFKRADKVLVDAVKSINRMINCHGYINLDLADLKNVLQRPTDHECGDALIGVGEAVGDGRAMTAALAALENPLLANADIKGATNLLVNVAGNENMGLREAQTAVQMIEEKAGEGDREIFMGVVTDNSMGDTMSVTVIATGLGLNAKQEERKIIKQQKFNLALESKYKEEVISLTSIEKDISKECAVGFGHSESEIVQTRDNFGIAPLINRTEWKTPAYLRRDSRYQNHQERTGSARRIAEPNRKIEQFPVINPRLEENETLVHGVMLNLA